ncbi:putative monodehydroascorbate reductase (NADH) [Helianthus anomalus]
MGSVLSSFWGEAEQTSNDGDASSAESRVIEFHSSNRWQLHYNESKQSPKLMVVDFSASWCGPCKMLEPFIRSLSSKYPEIDFIKIDVDELQDVAQQFGVQAMPTLVLLKQGKEVERVIGAKKDELEKKILKHRATPKFAA